jgi:hypothetical protein
MVAILPKKILDESVAMAGHVSNEDGIVDARFVIATDDILAQAVPTEAEQGAATLDVEPGDFLAVYRGADQQVHRVKVSFRDLFDEKADVANQFLVGRPGTDESMRFLGRHMLKAREELFLATRENGGTELAGARRLLGSLQFCFEQIDADPEAYPADAQKDAFMARIVDAMGDVALPVEPEAFIRKARADAIRSRIAGIDPRHPDGLSRDPSNMDEVLIDAGLAGGGVYRGAEVRGPAGQKLNDAAMVRIVQSNDRLCREVFGAMTKAEISALSVRMISVSEAATLRRHFEETGAELGGEWIDTVRARIGALTTGNFQGYTFQATIAEKDGRDILVVTDSVSNQANVGYVYSWPTVDRHPVMDVARGRIATFGEEDVPSEAEVARLAMVLEDLEENNNDFDMDDDIDEAFALPVPRPDRTVH